MLELYHTRDAVCPIKVRVTLAEKALEWTSHVAPDMRSPDYLALNPSGYVPTLVEGGAESKWIAIAARRFRKLATDIDNALKTRTWLAGESYSLADIDLGIYALRMKQMRLDLLWADLPRTADWIARVHACAAFQSGVYDWLTDVERDLYKLGSATVQAAVRRCIDAPHMPA